MTGQKQASRVTIMKMRARCGAPSFNNLSSSEQEAT